MLKSLKKQSKYKSNNAWIDAIYRANKQRIDIKLQLADRKVSRGRILKQVIVEKLENYGYYYEGGPIARFLNSIPKRVFAAATNKVTNSDIFTSAGERAKTNIYQAVKDFGQLRQLRQLSGEVGRGKKGKITAEDFRWDKNLGMYVYKDKVAIDIKNSPYEISLRKL